MNKIYESKNLVFKLPEMKHYDSVKSYIEEFKRVGDKVNGSGGLKNIDEYEAWLDTTKNCREGVLDEGWVASHTFFSIDKSDGEVVGMVNIRHYLNDYFIENGYGHIGYSIRPSKRRKGYAKEQFTLALQFSKSIGNDEVEVSCIEKNIGSKKTIESQNAKLIKKSIDDDGNDHLLYIVKTLS